MNRIIRTLSLLALVALVLGVLVVPASAQDATAPADSVDSAAIIDRTIEDVDIAQGELRLWNFTPWMRGTLRNANEASELAGDVETLDSEVNGLVGQNLDSRVTVLEGAYEVRQLVVRSDGAVYLNDSAELPPGFTYEGTLDVVVPASE